MYGIKDSIPNCKRLVGLRLGHKAEPNLRVGMGWVGFGVWPNQTSNKSRIHTYCFKTFIFKIVIIVGTNLIWSSDYQYPINMIFCRNEVLNKLYTMNGTDHQYGLHGEPTEAQ